MRSSMLRLWRDGRIRSRLRGKTLCARVRMTLQTRPDQHAQACVAPGILPGRISHLGNRNAPRLRVASCRERRRVPRAVSQQRLQLSAPDLLNQL